MPARSSVAKASHAAPLNRLATNVGEKCGLEYIFGHNNQRFSGISGNDRQEMQNAQPELTDLVEEYGKD
jgi:hypothetical protein